MKSTLILIMVLSILVLFARAQSPTRDISTPLGTITGYLSNGKTGYEYRGIKYVNPYTRWQHSTVANQTFPHFDAKNDISGCPQSCQLPPHTCPMKYNELDCLGLNIFTQVETSTVPIPVMVYFPGGNYFQGGNDTPLYNGTSIANLGNTIVVVVNYRLGILGYYRDEPNGIYGNYGTIDQLNALKWVKTQIKSFGGDENNVTIFGQSAGGGSVAVHLISKYSEGLFHKAIIHSNPFVIPFRSIKTKNGLIKAYQKYTSCNTRQCLLELTSDQIIKAQVETSADLDAASGNIFSMFIPFNPYVESPGFEPLDPEYPGLVPHQPHEAFLRGFVKDIPIMIGAVTQEADIFIYEAFNKPIDNISYFLFGLLIFGDTPNRRIQERYPPLPWKDNRDQLSIVASEYIFHCPTRNAVSGALKTTVHKPLYTYIFNHIFKFNSDMWGPDFSICSAGSTGTQDAGRVCHAGELPGLWNSAQWMFDYSPEDQIVADQMGYFWTNFAHSGDPNIGPNQSKLNVKWEPYSTAGKTMSLEGKESHMVTNYLGESCDFWDSIGYFS